MTFSIPRYPLQPWMDLAYRYRGLKEVLGVKNNPTIMGWAKRLGTKILGMTYNADSVPWCGLFIAHIMDASGFVPVKIAVRAKSWANFGVAITPVWGAILVFNRPGGGHVCFYHAEDETHYHVLGANQSDSVNIMRIEKSRLTASRWPAAYQQFPNTGQHFVDPGGTPVSRNEI